jgi:nicotinamide riboside kinase
MTASLPPLRIAVLGAECTGKTTLCRALAQARGGLWVPEYLREFVDSQDRPPLAHEQAAIVAEQIGRETRALTQAAASGQPLVAADSAPLATALYSRLYFDDDSLLAAATAHQRCYDLVFVTDVDLPWEPDGLQRDGPQMRARFHELLLDCLRAHAIGFTRVSGTEAARLAAALNAVDALSASPGLTRAAR